MSTLLPSQLGMLHYLPSVAVVSKYKEEGNIFYHEWEALQLTGFHNPFTPNVIVILFSEFICREETGHTLWCSECCNLLLLLITQFFIFTSFHSIWLQMNAADHKQVNVLVYNMCFCESHHDIYIEIKSYSSTLL